MAIEGVKIAPKYTEILDEHFGGVAPDWMAFQKRLKDKKFTQAVTEDTRANDKLKAFVSAVSMREQEKGPSTKVKSDVQGNYTVKYHSEADRFSCTCPDWTFKKSISGADCKHIQRMRATTKDRLMTKSKIAMMPAAEVLFRVGNSVRRQEKDQNMAARLKAQNQMVDQAFPQQSFVQQWLKSASVPIALANAAKLVLGK
jgi:hypothetical protein